MAFSITPRTLRRCACAAAICLALMAACRSIPDPAAHSLAAYRDAEARTRPGAPETRLLPESPEEAAALQRFVDFYRVYSAEVIRARVRELYADDAYFGDPFEAVTGIDRIEAYFLQMAEPVDRCAFEIEAIDGSKGEYYVRWTMNLTLRRAKKVPIVAPGISHVRFNPAGKVAFQQDYWDTRLLFERLPVVGGLTRFVSARMAGGRDATPAPAGSAAP